MNRIDESRDDNFLNMFKIEKELRVLIKKMAILAWILIISPCVNAVDINRFLKVFQMAKRSDFFKKNQKKQKKQFAVVTSIGAIYGFKNKDWFYSEAS